jgi:hypothetical protein
MLLIFQNLYITRIPHLFVSNEIIENFYNKESLFLSPLFVPVNGRTESTGTIPVTRVTVTNWGKKLLSTVKRHWAGLNASIFNLFWKFVYLFFFRYLLSGPGPPHLRCF